jgi:streptogramin lyase/cytochrome c2
MTTLPNPLRCIAQVLFFMGLCQPVLGDLLPGMGQLSGSVTGVKPGLLATAMARHTETGVGFMVFVVDGRYRAVNLFPGDYEVTITPAVGQVFTAGFAAEMKEVRIAAGEQAKLDFELTPQTYGPDYVGGMTYKGGWSEARRGVKSLPPSPDASVAPYDDIYPPGPGRDILERRCMGCHTVQLFAYNFGRAYASGRPLHDKAGWGITVDRMHEGAAFGKPNKQSYFDAKLLSDADRDTLVDYLAENFGPDSEPRVVQLESEPELDLDALKKAQYVEYHFPNLDQRPKAGTHHIGFTTDGYVWASERSDSLIWLDPRTGQYKEYFDHGRTEGLVVDKDNSVWINGPRHFDPKTELHDVYAFDGPEGGAFIFVSTLIFDSSGDLWLSLLANGGIGKWDRSTDSIVWWDVPILRSRPYGITLDHNEKVWFAEYHNSSVASFDPKSETFRNYQITDAGPTNLRRLAADADNMIWAVTWGSQGMQDGALYRLNPETEAVAKYPLNIPYANPYDVAPDEQGHLWVATDNYLVRFDPETEEFTNFPLLTRSDVPRLSITAEGTVWHALRNAGHTAGYGGTAVALYPDKDNIQTYAARYSDKSVHSLISKYDGPSTKVAGTTKRFPPQPQNPGAFNKMLIASGIEPVADAVSRPNRRSATANESIETQTNSAGKALYAQCVTCHTLEQGGTHLNGPNLWGIFGSKAASQPGVAYSQALRGSGLVWTDTTIDNFLRKPAEFIPNNTMAFIGIADAQARRELIEYLKAATAN